MSIILKKILLIIIIHLMLIPSISGNVSTDEPIIKDITIAPDKPNPLSEINITADIEGENIQEVYIRIQELNSMSCLPKVINESMANIDGLWVAYAQLKWNLSTKICYWFEIKVNGSWYDNKEDRLYHDLYPEINILKPEIGYLYILGKQVAKSNFNNTILFVRAKIKVDFGTYFSEDIVKVEFYLNNELKVLFEEGPYTWYWRNFSLGKYDLEVKIYIDKFNYSSTNIEVFAFIL